MESDDTLNSTAPTSLAEARAKRDAVDPCDRCGSADTYVSGSSTHMRVCRACAAEDLAETPGVSETPDVADVPGRKPASADVGEWQRTAKLRAEKERRERMRRTQQLASQLRTRRD